MGEHSPPSEGAVFAVARQITSEEARREYLDQVCGDDDATRDRILELLAGDRRDSFLEKPVVCPVETLDGPGLSEREGHCIGPYKLLQQIGEGGFGVVHMAEQQRPVKRKVALKVIKPGMDTKEVIGRFEAERQALAMMDHPNIAKVLDAGTTESGRPYFVMELVRGISITDYCDRERLSPRERLQLFVKVCQAVQHAHQKGVIHRDIKPSNVLVTEHDGTPVPKVIDFGVAKAVNQQLTERTLFTRFQQMVGTPMYMSPEQADLSGLDVDTRTDIYSLGVLLYELLTGSAPFDKQRFAQAAYDEVRRFIREEEPPKPSTRVSSLGKTLDTVSSYRRTDPRRLAQMMRGELDWVIMKAIEKDRKRRYETASSFGSDIQRFLNNEPVSAAAPSALYRVRKFTRRHSLAITVTAIVAVSLIVGFSVATISYFRERDARSAAEQRRVEADDARKEADAARAAEQEERMQAEANALQARKLQYAADMNLAFSALERLDTSQVVRLLERHIPTADHPDWRGWEWRYLWRKTHQNMGAMKTHDGWFGVEGLAVFPDGRYLAVGGDKKNDDPSRTSSLVKIVDLESLQIHQVLPEIDAARITDLTFFKNRKFLAIDCLGYPGTGTLDSLTVADLDKQDVSKPVAPLGDAAWPTVVAPDGSWAMGTFRGHELRLMTCADESELPVEGQALNVVAKIDRKLHFRVFDFDGRRVADRAEAELAPSEELDSLKRMLADHWKEPAPEPAQQTEIHWPLLKVLEFPFREVNHLRAFDFDTGQELAKSGLFEANSWWGLSERIRLSPDGNSLAVGCLPDRILLLSAPELKTLRSIHVGGEVNTLDWSRDARLLAVGLRFGGCEVRDVASGDLKVSFSGASAAPMTRVRFSADGSLLATAAEDQSVVVWEVDTGKVRDIFAHDGHATALHFLPDGKRLATGDGQGIVRLWDISPSEATALRGMKQVFDVQYSPQDGRVLAATSRGVVKLFDADTESLVAELRASVAIDRDQAHDKDTRAPVCFSPDGRLLVVGNGDQTATVHDLTKNEPIQVMSGTTVVQDIAFHPSGNHFAIAHLYDKNIRLWDPHAGTQVNFVTARDGRARSAVQFSPDGKRLAFGSIGVHLWHADGAEPFLGSISQPSDADLQGFDNGTLTDILKRAFADHGKPLGSEATIVAVVAGRKWQVEEDNGNLFLLRYEGDSLDIHEKQSGGPELGEIPCLQFSPDGDVVACGNKKGEVHLYAVPDLKLIRTFTGLAGHVYDLSFSPDGVNLLAVSRGGLARIFNLKVMSEVGDVVHSSSDWLVSGTFSPDGNSLAIVARRDGVRQFHAISNDQMPGKP